MPIKEITVNSTSEYVKEIETLHATHKKLWFRGHGSANYTLQPTIYRTPYSANKQNLLLHQFKARAARFISDRNIKDIEWLFIMQHYATPTRLLDWSESALVALAFATQYRNDKHSGMDANIWCLDPLILNSLLRFKSLDTEPIPNICDVDDLREAYEGPSMDYPVAIIGPQSTSRIVAQKGVFTLFPAKEISFNMEDLPKANEFLTRIIIPDIKVVGICEELYYLGITESTLFPEMESISKEIKREFERR